MWLFKLAATEGPWLTHFNHDEIYNRLKNFYNHVLGTASSLSIRGNDKTLKEDIENMRFNLQKGQCKLHILSKKGQEFLILEYDVPKNKIKMDHRWKPHFFSQRRFYLLPSSEQYLALKNEINMEVLIDHFRVSGVIDEAILYEVLVDHKKTLTGEYQLRPVSLKKEEYQSLNPLYQIEKKVSTGQDTFNDLLEDYPDADKIEIHDDFLKTITTNFPSSKENPSLSNTRAMFVYRNTEVFLDQESFKLYLKQRVEEINERAKDDREALKSIWFFMNSLYLKMKDLGLEHTDAAQILIKESRRYR